MDKIYFFDSKFSLGEKIPEYSQNIIKNEIMFFNCDFEYSWKHGGPITKAFLDAIPDEWKNSKDFVLDSRVHMLMKGWFPAIPGYHHDDIPRTRSDNQPNYDTSEYFSEHVMCLVNGGVAPTEFAIGKCNMNDVPLGEIIYKQWHEEVLNHLKTGVLEKVNAPSNQLLFFDWQTFHQAVRAFDNGWRWFVRVSRNTDRKPTNEIRRQVQVYLENPMEGW